MALLYPWATKDYCLWKMTIGQLFLYHNLGIEMKYGKRSTATNGQQKSVSDMTYDEAREWRREVREQFGMGAVDG